MKRRKAYRIGLVLTGMAIPALAAELEEERATQARQGHKPAWHGEPPAGEQTDHSFSALIRSLRGRH